MARTISSTITTGVTLTAADDPLTIATGGAVNAGSGTAIYGDSSQGWQVRNAGLVDTAGQYGIELLSASVVSNTGSIIDTAPIFGRAVRISGGPGTAINSGTIESRSDAVLMTDGGTVINTGWIGGSELVDIYIGGGPATVTNAGTIAGPGGAVLFGGSYADRVIVDPGAVFFGEVLGGSGGNTLELAEGSSGTGRGSAPATGTIGSIGKQFNGFGTIAVDSSAVWVFDDTNTIANSVQLTDDGTLINQGSIDATVTVSSGATLDNSGSIGGIAVAVLLVGGTVVNESAATIVGETTAIKGVTLPGVVSNAGSIGGANGVGLTAGGSVYNLVGGLIGVSALGVYIEGAAGRLTNAGTISGTDAVDMRAGGSVTNQAGGLLIGGHVGAGVYMTGGASTVTNAGTIAGGSLGAAVKFGGSFADRVIVDPGAVFDGQVTGGQGSNTLELAALSSAAVKGSFETGTIGGIGSQFTGFGTITVDAHALWVFDATDTVASSVRLSDNGVLLNRGSIAADVTVANGATLIDYGTMTGGTGAILQGGTVENQSAGSIGSQHDGVYGTTSAGVVINAGRIGSTGEYGVDLHAGGTVVNLSGGLITGEAVASVRVVGAAGTVTNSGTIIGRAYGIVLDAGGSVSNLTGGTIFGTQLGGAYIGGGAGTVTNAGTISGLGGVRLKDGGAVTNLTGGSISGTGREGIYIVGGAGTVSNAGTIKGAGNIGNQIGVHLLAGGSVDNLTGGSIAGDGSYAIIVQGGSGSVANAGGISGSGGIDLAAGGWVGNLAGGAIFGTAIAVKVTGDAGTLSNDGTILGGLSGSAVRFAAAAGTVANSTSGIIAAGVYGVVLESGGSVNNAGSIGANTEAGVYIYGGAGTVSDAGNIRGGSDAVRFAGSFADRVILYPGAVLQGTVQGGTGTNTLELAAGTAGAIGTVSGFAAEFIGFGTIALDSGAQWELGGVSPAEGQYVTMTGGGVLLALDTPSGFADRIYGFGASDKLDLTGLTFKSGASATLAGAVLTVTSGGVTDTLKVSGLTSGTRFSAVSDGANGGTLVREQVVCFCAGTRIATPAGEVPVESLTVGDLVLTASGAARPAVWIGQGRVLATRGRRTVATPVIVRKGALADNVPNGDLRITKAHSLYIDGVLIPVEFLVNHRSILWDDAAREVSIYHVELATHDVVLANGAPAESYRDDGNRWLFRNASSGWDLPPQPACAPVLTGGAVVDAVWRRLLDRAGPRPAVAMTDDPDLHLLVDGRRLSAVRRIGEAHIFALLGRPAEVRIRSRRVEPQAAGFARDPRCLGVALRRIAVQRGVRMQVTEADDPRLTDGFHAFEPELGVLWTDGDAGLPAALLDGWRGPLQIVLMVGATTHYRADAARGPEHDRAERNETLGNDVSGRADGWQPGRAVA